MSSEAKRTSTVRRTKKTKASSEVTVDDAMAFIDEHNLINRCRNYLRQQKPLVLRGRPGTGKTTLVQMLAEGFPMYTIVGTEMVTADIVGRYVLENTSMIWTDGLLLKAMREGAWLYIDEILHMPDDCLRIMNPLLDGRLTVYVPQLREEVRAHESFRLISSFNPSANGSNSLPADFLDRMRVVRVPPLSSEKEQSLLVSRYGITQKLARQLVKLAEISRKPGSLATISTRLLESAAEGIKSGVEFRDAVHDCMLNPAFAGNTSAIQAFCSTAAAMGFAVGLDGQGGLDDAMSQARRSITTRRTA